MKKQELAVVMIVKNEENHLDKCLQTIKEADEIIISDTGSDDNTIKIAQKYTDKVYTEYKWKDDFANARNYALSKATKDWILSIDADERLENGGIEKIRKLIKNAKNKIFDLKLVSEDGGTIHYFPRLFKREPNIFWKGAIHNYLSITEGNQIDITIYYGYSDAHKRDNNRAFRILKRQVIKYPKCSREKFYLAREYYYAKDYPNAIWWYQKYLENGRWAPEMADSWLMMGRCYWELGDKIKARECCFKALEINADFKEPMLFLSEMMGPKNREKWVLFAEVSEDNDVLFKRTDKVNNERYYDASYYDNVYQEADQSRYIEIYQETSELAEGSVLDIGCGKAELQKYIKDYHGFDFSQKAVEKANNKNVWVGNAYDKSNYGNYDSYILLEVLEHLNDIKILNNIPSGKTIIFSVPRFWTKEHIRVYNEKIIKYRLGRLVDVEKIIRFNWRDNKWSKGGTDTHHYILLVKGKKV